MLKPIDNSIVEECLRKLMLNEGYTLTQKRSHGETGVDILARKGSESFHIECIGYKKSGSTRAKDFFESFFRCISRLNDGASHCVIALHRYAEVGLPKRAKVYRVAWLRIAKAFPELQIWLVDTHNNTYLKTTWREWLYR